MHRRQANGCLAALALIRVALPVKGVSAGPAETVSAYVADGGSMSGANGDRSDRGMASSTWALRSAAFSTRAEAASALTPCAEAVVLTGINSA